MRSLQVASWIDLPFTLFFWQVVSRFDILVTEFWGFEKHPLLFYLFTYCIIDVFEGVVAYG